MKKGVVLSAVILIVSLLLTACSANQLIDNTENNSTSVIVPAESEVLNEIGKKHDKSAAQVALRFLLQSDVVVIPKSTHKERMEENINVFDFALDASDMNAIQALDEKESLFFSHYDPAIAEMMIKLH